MEGRLPEREIKYEILKEERDLKKMKNLSKWNKKEIQTFDKMKKKWQFENFFLAKEKYKTFFLGISLISREVCRLYLDETHPTKYERFM